MLKLELEEYLKSGDLQSGTDPYLLEEYDKFKNTFVWDFMRGHCVEIFAIKQKYSFYFFFPYEIFKKI